MEKKTCALCGSETEFNGYWGGSSRVLEIFTCTDSVCQHNHYVENTREVYKQACMVYRLACRGFYRGNDGHDKFYDEWFASFPAVIQDYVRESRPDILEPTPNMYGRAYQAKRQFVSDILGIPF